MNKIIIKMTMGYLSVKWRQKPFKKHTTNFKSQTSKKNYILFLSIIPIMSTVVLSSCSIHHQKLKADVIGFNDDITKSYNYTDNCIFKKLRKQSEPYNLLNNKEQEQMKSFVYSLRQGQNTSAYYALDNGLDRVKYVQKKFMEKDPNSKYYVVMLTDGLDNNSVALANRNKGIFTTKYNTPEEYANKIQEKITETMKKYYFFDLFSGTNNNNQFQSFVLLYQGADLKESGYSNDELEKILIPYTGAQNIERPKPIMGENFDILLEKFSNELIQRKFNFEIPNGYIGKKVRMYLNNTDIWLEGNFVKEGSGFRFQIAETSDGLTMKSKNLISETFSYENKNSIYFSVEDLKLKGKPYKVTSAEQWFFDMGKLRKNSEYRAETNSFKNAYVIVILDSSLSFGDKFREAQNAVMKIIKTISDL